MRHRGVAADDGVAYLGGFDAVAEGGLSDELVYCGENTGAEFFEPLGGAGVIYATDDVEAACDLVVVFAASGDDLGEGQEDKFDCDGRGANIDGDAVMFDGGVAGLDADNVIAVAFADESYGDEAVFGAEAIRETPYYCERVDEFFFTPFDLEAASKAVEVAEAIAEFGGRDIDHPLDGKGIVLPVFGEEFVADEVDVVCGIAELAALSAVNFGDFDGYGSVEEFCFAGQNVAFADGVVAEKAEALGINFT